MRRSLALAPPPSLARVNRLAVTCFSSYCKILDLATEHLSQEAMRSMRSDVERRTGLRLHYTDRSAHGWVMDPEYVPPAGS